MSDFQNKTMRMDQTVILSVISLVVGFTLGMVVYHFTMGSPAQPQMMGQMQGQGMAPPTLQPPGAAMQNNTEHIRQLRKMVEQNPRDRNAWVELGNILFDNDQAADSVKAYTKALELDPNDPNVTTDRGIMYRRMGDAKAAIADFRKAAMLDGSHIQSLYNLGLVLAQDMNDLPGAKQAWAQLMARNPPPEMAGEISQRLAQINQLVPAGQK